MIDWVDLPTTEGWYLYKRPDHLSDSPNTYEALYIGNNWYRVWTHGRPFQISPLPVGKYWRIPE